MEKKILNDFGDMSYQDFKNIDEIKHLDIEESHLLIIFHIIKNNLFALADSHYFPVLLNIIKNKTSEHTCLQFKHLFSNDYFNISINS